MSAWDRALRGVVSGIALGASLSALGCDSGGHPDTGVGANQTPPAVMTCADLCQREAQCVADLCDEDTSSTNYDGLVPAFTDDCEANCTDADVQARIATPQWQCIFQSSCRQVFEYDVCHGSGRYNCT
jgi:hypothetical protein